jgi:hypothetical protein
VSGLIECVFVVVVVQEGEGEGEGEGASAEEEEDEDPFQSSSSEEDEVHILETHRDTYFEYTERPLACPGSVFPESPLCLMCCVMCSWWMWSWRRTWRPSKSMTPLNRASSHRHSYDTHSYRYNHSALMAHQMSR